MSPPKEDGAPKDPIGSSGPTTTPTKTHDTARDSQEGLQRRREAALRMTGANPDPLNPGRRYHIPPTGFRASGFRQGYAAALRYVLHDFGSQLDDLTCTKLAAIIRRSDSQ